MTPPPDTPIPRRLAASQAGGRGLQWELEYGIQSSFRILNGGRSLFRRVAGVPSNSLGGDRNT